MHDLAGLQEELFTLVQDPSNKDILLKEYFNKVFDIFQSIEPSHLTLEQSKVYFVEAVELFHAFRSLPFTELSFSIIQQLILLITSFSLNFNELLPVAIEEFESLLFTDSQELLILTVDSTNEILDNFYEFIWQNFLTLVVKIVEKGKSHSNKPYLALISMASTRLSQLTFISDLEYLDPSQSSYKILKVILILASFLKNPKLIDQCYAVITSILRVDNFDLNSGLVSPLARIIVLCSSDTENMINLCRFYEKIYFSSENISQKLKILEEIRLLVDSFSEANLNFQKRLQGFSMKFVTEALQHLLSDSKIEENALLLLEFILELLSRVCGQAHDLTFDQDARIFDIWSFLLFFNFKLAIFSQKNFQKLIEKFLLVTTSFHPCTMLPRKRSLVLAFLSDPVMTEKFLNFLKDSCKFLLDDAKCYIVTTYEAEELILLTLIYTTQSLKFLYGLDNDLSSYLYTYYIMSTPHINFDILFKVCQKALNAYVGRFSDVYAKKIIISLCPLLGQVKKVKLYIKLVADAFPYSFIDKRVLYALLNAVQMGHQIASLDICYSVLPEEPKIIYSDDPNFRIDLYHEIVEFAKIQLDKSLKLSPLIMHSLLQDFLILTANFSEPGRVNVCFNLILKCFSNHNEIPNSWLSLIRYNTNFLSTSGAPVTFQEDDILGILRKSCFEALSDLDPTQVTEGIKLWHRILTNSEKINLDVDWIHYVEESWVHVINEKRSSFSNLAYIDPFTQKMDSSPSKQPSLAIKEQKENFFLSLILFLAYLNEKVIYDLQSFSKAPFLPLLLKAYFSLFQTLILSATTVIFEFRSVCIQIISLGLNMIKCQENPTSDFSNTVRAMLMDCLAGLFSVPDRFYYSDKKRYQLECELKERCSLLLWDDFTRLNEHIKCKVVAFSDGVARDPLLLHEDPTIQLCEKVGSLKIKGSDSIKLQKTPIIFEIERKPYLDLALLFSYLIDFEVWKVKCTILTFNVLFAPRHSILDLKMRELFEKLSYFYPSVSLHLCVNLCYQYPWMVSKLVSNVQKNTQAYISHPDTLIPFLSSQELQNLADSTDFFNTCTFVLPIVSLMVLQKCFNHEKLVTFALASLSHFPPATIFFYVPQIVQLLRKDPFGLIRQFILATGKTSQLFAHQIIWNMEANKYLDEASTKPDPLKPLLEEIVANIVDSLVGPDKEFYEREFSFFTKVTSISGALKPYIKKSKAEKKARIDEELSKIEVDPGVYLPSSPESILVDIDYRSGRPLQSHAKAPFMATFKVKLATENIKSNESSELIANETTNTDLIGVVSKSVIFKVGDDCRQDVLALQLIATFKEIYQSVDLDLYLYPYRVVATAPGCGVIEVIPNSISRDQLGREKINGLYDYFIFKFGDSISSSAFHEARHHFIKSLAAYSVVTYLLAIRDRHNGNIMLDDKGNIIHIDFGFILDIAPGGIRFESSPFKLTKEMIKLMGDSSDSSYFTYFKELCVLAFLALRPYTDKIVALASLLFESNLPCFKNGETSISKFRSRFRLDLSPLEAKQYVEQLVHKSFNNTSTKIYDSFQYRTNEIPY